MGQGGCGSGWAVGWGGQAAGEAGGWRACASTVLCPALPPHLRGLGVKVALIVADGGGGRGVAQVCRVVDARVGPSHACDASSGVCGGVGRAGATSRHTPRAAHRHAHQRPRQRSTPPPRACTLPPTKEGRVGCLLRSGSLGVPGGRGTAPHPKLDPVHALACRGSGERVCVCARWRAGTRRAQRAPTHPPTHAPAHAPTHPPTTHPGPGAASATGHKPGTRHPGLK